MPGYDDLLRNYETDAAQQLGPILRETAAELGLDREGIERLNWAVARAYLAGVAAGQSEVIAQALEQGVELKQRHLRDSDTEQT
jgi:uncharacterized membrane protein